MVIEEYYVLAVSLSLILYFRMAQDYKGLAMLSKWVLIFIGITAILSIISSSIDPMYARNIIGVSGFSNQSEQLEILSYQKYGGGGYGFAGALIALFPIMVYYYRNIKISIFSKQIILLFGIICFIALLRMQIFANIIIAIIATILSLLGSKKIKSSLILICGLLIIMFSIPPQVYSEVLIGISRRFNPNSEIFFKLNDMASYLINGNNISTAAGVRAARYPLLLDAFLSNPFFGYYVTNHITDIGAGGHLHWMNKLTIFGFFGFIPHILIHIFFIKSCLKYFNREYSFYFLISIFSVLLLGFVKQLAGREMWLTYFLFLPGLYYLPILRRETIINEKLNISHHQ